MGRIEVFIHAAATLGIEKNLEFFVSNIFAFLFLPYNAGRDNSAFTGQGEINRCMKRKEEILRALKLVIGRITDQKMISEIVMCLETCEQLPSMTHKLLILEICTNITEIAAPELGRLETLIKKIMKSNPELQDKSLQAWGWASIKYAEIILSNLLDEHLDIKYLQTSILQFFQYCTKENITVSLQVLEQLWKIADIDELQVSVAYFVLNQLCNQGNFDVALGFINNKPVNDAKYFVAILKNISGLIRKYDNTANKIVMILSKFPQGSMLFNYFLPDILTIFQVRKNEFTGEEIVFINESIKILMTLLLKAPDKSKAVSGIFPLFLALFHKSVPVQVIKGMSKAMNYMNVNFNDSFKVCLEKLSEAEKKFVESQLETQSAAIQKTVAQPTITLQLRFKKP